MKLCQNSKRELLAMIRDIEYSLEENRPIIAYNRIESMVKEIHEAKE